jgi:polyisoprenoid-binding protein YceI
MRLIALGALFLGFVASGRASADPISLDPLTTPAGAYALDKRHASLLVRVRYLGGHSQYVMRFNRVDGSFTYDPDSWQGTKVAIAIDPRSIETEHSFFNEIASRYFEPGKYPAIQFTSTGLTSDREGHGKLTGELTLHGLTRPVTLDVAFNGVGSGPMGAGARLGFSGTGRIKRSEFWGTAGRPFANDVVDLLFQVEFIKK